MAQENDIRNLPPVFRKLKSVLTNLEARVDAIAGLDAAELAVINGAQPGEANPGKAIVADANGDVTTTPYVRNFTMTGTLTHAAATGTDAAKKAVAAAGAVAGDYGDNTFHKTVLFIDQDAAVTTGDTASLADGTKIATLPAGRIAILSAVAELTVANAEHNGESIDIGIGTTIAAGAVSVLGGTPAFENILTGQTAAVGTAKFAAVNTPLVIGSGDSHEVFVNLAAAWANTAGAALDADVSGFVVLEWVFLS